MTNTSIKSDNKIYQYQWLWQKSSYTIEIEQMGKGKPMLLLPAFSTVSSRQEMKGIAELLADKYEVNYLDWLGFGESQRPSLDYQPSLYQALLTDFVKDNFSEAVILVVAGHSAGYALKLAKNYPDLVAKIILIAPTWKGPLKVMGVPNKVSNFIKNVVHTPILGQFLYYLNTTPAFLKFMYRRHVYVNENLLNPAFIAEKREITQKKGARFAPAAFVTGCLDPIENQEEFLQLISSLEQPTLTIIGDNSPPYSLSQMKAVASLKNIQTISLSGTLGMAEEYYNVIAPYIREFCEQ